jgi:hypothetical protein
VLTIPDSKISYKFGLFRARPCNLLDV